MKIKQLALWSLFLIVLTPFFSQKAYATHSGNRIFFFLDRPQEGTTKKTFEVEPAFFYSTASTACTSKGKSRSMPEMWGIYNLKDVVAGLTQETGKDPFQPSTESLKGKDIVFKISDKIQAVGLSLGGVYNTPLSFLQIGAWLPVAAVKSTAYFILDRRNSSPALNGIGLSDDQLYDQEVLVDLLRRNTHEMLGFNTYEQSQCQFGDLDLFLRANKTWDHKLLMRSIMLSGQCGFLLPTGQSTKASNPFSCSLGHEGHLGFYGDLHARFELKQDWTFGLVLGLISWSKETETKGVPVGKENFLFSSLRGPVVVDPATLLKFSPYFIMGNLTDGLNFQARYTYMRKGSDSWSAVKDDNAFAIANPAKATEIHNLLDTKTLKDSIKDFSRWATHYFTFQVSYDTIQALNKEMKLAPVFFLSYDMPMSGRGVAKTHQVTFGAELYF